MTSCAGGAAYGFDNVPGSGLIGAGRAGVGVGATMLRTFALRGGGRSQYDEMSV